jgi:hypothetical protein
MLKILSYVLAMIVLVMALVNQTDMDPMTFIDFSSGLILILPCLMCLLNFSGQELKQSLQVVFSNQVQSKGFLTTASQLLTSLGKYQLTMLFFMWLLALIVLLPINQSNPMVSVGHHLAIILISSIYLIFFKLFVLLPMQTIVQRKLILQQSQV